MRKIAVFWLALAFWVAPAPATGLEDAATGKPDVATLSVLDRFEPWGEGHLFHAGHLWVGRSRKDLGAYYRLEVYTSAGKLRFEKELRHSLRYVYPYGADAVIVVGIGTDQRSHYTVARLRGDALSIDAVTIPIQALADRWAGAPGRHFFTDPGGFDDPSNPTPPSEPLPTLFRYQGSGRPAWLRTRIAGPSHPLLVGDALYVLGAPSIFSGGKTLRKVDTRTEAQAILLDGRDRLVNMIALPGTSLLALAEAGASQVLLFDHARGALAATIPVKGTPRGLAPYGKCLAVATEDTRQVLFHDLGALAPDGRPAAVWDLSVAGDALLGIRALAADPASGRVYARSAYACSPVEPCDEARNAVVMATPAAGDAAVAACL